MNDNSELVNLFSTIDSPDSLMTKILQKISKESSEIKNKISSISEKGIESSELVEYILEEIDEDTQANNLLVETDSDSTETVVDDFPNNSSKILIELSKATTNRFFQYLPKQYSKFLPSLPDLFNQIYEISKNPEQEISRISEEKINEILDSISNEYLKLSVENFSISGEEKNEEVKFDLKSIITPPKPFVKIKMIVLGSSKELGKITFQIKGTLDITDIGLSKNKSKYILNPGELNFTLDLWLHKLSLIGKDNLLSKEKEDGVKKLATCKYEKKFKKITLS